MNSIVLQKGFSIVSALFILVVLSLISTYIINLSVLNFNSVQLGFQGAKAYYAAKSGLEWGIYQVAPSAVSGGAPPYNCPASPTTLNFTEGGLVGFRSIVTCNQTSFVEYGSSYNTFEITATGQYGIEGDLDYAYRKLYITIIQPGT